MIQYSMSSILSREFTAFRDTNGLHGGQRLKKDERKSGACKKDWVFPTGNASVQARPNQMLVQGRR